jgi:hypothetical protein
MCAINFGTIDINARSQTQDINHIFRSQDPCTILTNLAHGTLKSSLLLAKSPSIVGYENTFACAAYIGTANTLTMRE